MILLDRVPLVLESINEKTAKHHDFAKEYNDTLVLLKERHPRGVIHFKRQGAVKYTKGADSTGREIPKMVEPVIPWRIPLQAYAVTEGKGRHFWSCCMSTPEPQANGLWDMGRTRSMSIKENIFVDLNKDPDLAFFFYKISPFVRKRLIVVSDPIADDATIGEAERALTERKYAIWNMLSDEPKLLKMARAYGVNSVDTKQPNAIRKELESLLENNDKLQRQNPAIKGTKEFLEEMNVTDGVLLRAFVQEAIDDKKLTWSADGRWKIGTKIIIQVPHGELQRKSDYLCNYLMAGNNAEKLQDFMRDFINKEYLDNIKDKKEWIWLAKIASVPSQFKKMEEVKEKTKVFFCPI